MAEMRLAQETNVLAAARAALDPERAAWQHDILISTIIEVLARKAPLTRRELRTELTATLVGQEANPALITEALRRAQQEDLIECVQGRRGHEQWSLPAAIRAEANADRQWAELLLSEAEAEIASRLTASFPEDATIASRASKLTKELIGAMVRASRDVFDAVQRSASPTDLREVRLNLKSVVPDLRSRVQPEAVADFMAEILLSAASPDETFGNELLTKIVAGQILHGMVCRDDVEGTLPPSRLVLDTSQLLSLASHDDRVVELVDTFLKTAKQHGCALVVTDRVKSEWDAHWALADDYMAKLGERYRGNHDALRLHAHLALREYGYAVERGAKSFSSWSAPRRDLDRFIREYGMEVVQADEAELDTAFILAFSEGIRDLQENSSVTRRVRGAEFRTTDAVSAALVRAHRESHPQALVPSAWFVAYDRSSNEVYGRIVQDPFPLVVRASTWMLHYAAFEGDAASDSRAAFADRLSEDLVVGAFLSVAASYTNDEMLELGDLLSEGDHLDEEDVRGFLLEGFLHPDQVAEGQIRDLARARLRRQGDRVVRARKLEGDAERRAAERLGAAQAKIDHLEHQIASRGDESGRLRRALKATVVLGLVLIALVISTVLAWGMWMVLLMAWSVFAYLCFEGVSYVGDGETPVHQRVAAVGTVGAITIASVIAGKLIA